MEKTPFTGDYELFLTLLKELRIQSGLTQEDMAAALNETQSFVSKCERGERRIDIIELRQLCQAIGVTLPDFAAQLEAKIQARQGKHD